MHILHIVHILYIVHIMYIIYDLLHCLQHELTMEMRLMTGILQITGPVILSSPWLIASSVTTQDRYYLEQLKFCRHSNQPLEPGQIPTFSDTLWLVVVVTRE
jgi:hypothetical protein